MVGCANYGVYPRGAPLLLPGSDVSPARTPCEDGEDRIILNFDFPVVIAYIAQASQGACFFKHRLREELGHTRRDFLNRAAQALGARIPKLFLRGQHNGQKINDRKGASQAEV